MQRRSLLAAAIAAAPQSPSSAASNCTATPAAAGITEQDFREYIAAFNRSDFPGFARYYADNVVFEGTGRHFEGPEQILAFYRTVKARLRETLTIRTLVVGSQDIAAELETELVAFEDWLDLPTGPIHKGETIRSLSFVWYEVQNGKLTHIRSARYRRL